MARDETQRIIRLYCPSVHKILDYVAWNDQKLDFRSIAAAFGLEPSTVKLNGYFISRDIDLIASCVTWQSLLAFFSARGLSTGEDEAHPLLVDGKLSKVGNKRPHIDSVEDLIKTKKLKDKCSGVGECLVSGCYKRKLMSEEDSHSLKKLKLNMDDDNSFGRLGSPLKCSDGLKRMREDDMIGSASCKKIRLEKDNVTNWSVN